MNITADWNGVEVLHKKGERLLQGLDLQYTEGIGSFSGLRSRSWFAPKDAKDACVVLVGMFVFQQM